MIRCDERFVWVALLGAELRFSRRSGFELPEGACGSWQALYTGVEKLVTDLTEHIHLENNVLFPRILTLEEEVCRG